MELISYDAFGRLRLAEFAPRGEAPAALKDWEYEDDLWVGEALGFTEILRLAEEPAVVRSVALDLGNSAPAIGARVLGAIGLPVSPGMMVADVVAALGEPLRVARYAADRQTLVYRIGEGAVYDVTCTVAQDGGLVYVTVLAPTPRRLAVEHLEADT